VLSNRNVKNPGREKEKIKNADSSLAIDLGNMNSPSCPMSKTKSVGPNRSSPNTNAANPNNLNDLTNIAKPIFITSEAKAKDPMHESPNDRSASPILAGLLAKSAKSK